GDALAAARLAHHTQRLAPLDRERDAIDGLDQAIHDMEVRPQITYIEEHVWAARGTRRALDDGCCVSHLLAAPRVECVAQAITDEVDRYDRQGDGHAREKGPPPVAEDERRL